METRNNVKQEIITDIKRNNDNNVIIISVEQNKDS